MPFIQFLFHSINDKYISQCDFYDKFWIVKSFVVLLISLNILVLWWVAYIKMWPVQSFLYLKSKLWSEQKHHRWCYCYMRLLLTLWGRVTHICVSKLTIIGSDNGLSPGRRQAIIITNAGILLIRPLGTNFSEILIEILTISFKKMCLKVSSAKWRLFSLSLNELTVFQLVWYKD